VVSKEEPAEIGILIAGAEKIKGDAVVRRACEHVS
jgi:fatty acid/phospholipid biosynthesis enzyme